MTDNTNFNSLEQAFSLGNGQEDALNWLRTTKQVVAVFLISGIKLEGVVTGHDQYSLLLTDSHGNKQLVYKAKISTITLVQQPGSKSHGGYNNRPPKRNYNNSNNNQGGNSNN